MRRVQAGSPRRKRAVRETRLNAFIDHAMRFGGVELARHGEQCPGRNHIVNGEAELPWIGRRFAPPPQASEQESGVQFEFQRIHRRRSGRTLTWQRVGGSARIISRPLFENFFQVLWRERESL